MERSLISKNTWKTPLHHNETDSGCRNVRGLAAYPQAADKVPKGYYSGQGLSPENCGV